MDNVVKCDKCEKPASLVNDSWVCHDCKHFISKKMEIFSRVVGYIRPIDQYNKGKQQEFNDRKVFVMEDE